MSTPDFELLRRFCRDRASILVAQIGVDPAEKEQPTNVLRICFPSVANVVRIS